MTKKSRDRRVAIRAKQRQRRLIKEVFEMEFKINRPNGSHTICDSIGNPVLFWPQGLALEKLNNPQFANQETRRL